jgi:AcrR family transcriptional regulator
MALQARAEATRRRILDSAVDLFDEMGYGETGLADILQRAGVSKGAFYYHFDSKEAVATAIIEEYRHKVEAAARAVCDPSASELENMIKSTINSAAILASDKAAWVGHELLQALSQISSIASQTYRKWTDEFVAKMSSAIEPWVAQRGIDAAEAAEAIWVGILGSHLLSAAIREDHVARLARSWKLALQMLAPADAVDGYYVMLNDFAVAYAVV